MSSTPASGRRVGVKVVLAALSFYVTSLQSFISSPRRLMLTSLHVSACLFAVLFACTRKHLRICGQRAGRSSRKRFVEYVGSEPAWRRFGRHKVKESLATFGRLSRFLDTGLELRDELRLDGRASHRMQVTALAPSAGWNA